MIILLYIINKSGLKCSRMVEVCQFCTRTIKVKLF
nr:MAG TPA: hypothetical protein [Caudoviricetes sp.]